MSTNKSFSTETSERYSRALFEVSKESNELDKVEDEIKSFKSILNSNVEINNFIKDPTQSIEQQNRVIILLTDKLEFCQNLKNFLLLLIKKRRIFFIQKILETFLRMCSKNRGEIKASLISSRELSQPEIETISKDLSSAMSSTLTFDYKFDEELIGGLKLQLGSYMIDTSIKDKLKKLEQRMLEN